MQKVIEVALRIARAIETYAPVTVAIAKTIEDLVVQLQPVGATGEVPSEVTVRAAVQEALVPWLAIEQRARQELQEAPADAGQ